MRTPALLVLALALFLASPAFAGTVFFDDFQGGNLDKWTGTGGGGHNALLVTDPHDGSNTSIYFSAVNSAGDIFEGSAVAVGVGTLLTLEFDYMGPIGLEGGGYIGYSAGTPGSHTWLLGTGSVSGAKPLLVDDGAWHSYSITFNSNYSSVRVMIEDFSGPNSTAFNAYFDNVRLSVVPLPAAAWMGLGLLGLLGAARRIRRRR